MLCNGASEPVALNIVVTIAIALNPLRSQFKELEVLYLHIATQLASA